MCRLGTARKPHGTIREAQHPGPEGGVEAGRRFRVGVHDVCEVAVFLLAVSASTRSPCSRERFKSPSQE